MTIAQAQASDAPESIRREAEKVFEVLNASKLTPADFAKAGADLLALSIAHPEARGWCETARRNVSGKY